jgi:aryl-alcohol dehydrogenase-like predicted oxidoreductase
VSKIILGTAQFGLDYGISNKDGQTSKEEINKVLNLCLDQNISALDTAPAYGSSESVLGEYEDIVKFKISTKVDVINPEEIRDSITSSLSKLGIEKIEYLLVHNENLLLNNMAESYYAELKSLKDDGLVSKIGVSSYSPNKLKQIVCRFDIDVVQIPVSVFDQSFLKANFLQELKKQEIEIHVRSIFLQGLVFMDPENIDPFFNPVKSKLTDFKKISDSLGLTSLELAVAFVQEVKEIDSFVVGVRSARDLEDVLQSTQVESKSSVDWGNFDFDIEAFSKPNMWKLSD